MFIVKVKLIVNVVGLWVVLFLDCLVNIYNFNVMCMVKGSYFVVFKLYNFDEVYIL